MLVLFEFDWLPRFVADGLAAFGEYLAKHARFAELFGP